MIRIRIRKIRKISSGASAAQRSASSSEKKSPWFYDRAFRSAPNSALGGRRGNRFPILARRAGNRIARTLTTHRLSDAHCGQSSKRAHSIVPTAPFFFFFWLLVWLLVF
jgi:hypothetical protein